MSDSIYVTPECLKQLDGMNLGRQVGSGFFSKVYELCSNLGLCDKIVKLVPLGNDYGNYVSFGLSNFENEVKVTRLASKLGIGPLFYKAFVCSDMNLGLLIQDRWDMTLEQFMEGGGVLPRLIRDKLENKVRLMHTSGIGHDDLYPRNIVLKMGMGPVDVGIIDFGRAVLRENVTEDDFEKIVRQDEMDLDNIES